MARRLYLHIGMSKTGSSAIQHALHAHPERLAALGLEYAGIGRIGVNHLPLAHELIGPGWETSPTMAQLRAHVRTATKDVVVSAEALEGVPAERMRAALGGTDVSVICYVRPGTQRMPSVYSQNTKFGLSVADFDSFFAQQHVESAAHWRPGIFLGWWADAFPGRVRVRSLDEAALKGGDLLDDFMAALGVDEPHGLQIPEGADAENMTPGWRLVEALRWLHSYVVGGSTGPQERMADQKLWPYLHRAYQLALPIASELGWSDRRPYLNGEQYDLLARLWDEDRAAVAELEIDHALSPLPDTLRHRSIRDRMPEASQIESEKLAQFVARLAPELLRFQRHQLLNS